MSGICDIIYNQDGELTDDQRDDIRAIEHMLHDRTDVGVQIQRDNVSVEPITVEVALTGQDVNQFFSDVESFIASHTVFHATQTSIEDVGLSMEEGTLVFEEADSAVPTDEWNSFVDDLVEDI